MLLRTARTRQPQSVTGVNTASPLTRALSFLYSPIHGPREVVSGIPAESFAVSGPPYPGVGLAGVNVRGGSSRAAYWNGGSFDASSDYTVASVVVDDAGRGAIRNPFDGDTGTTARVFQLRMTAANTVNFITFNTAGANFSATSTAATSATGLTVIFGRIKANALSVWINGNSDGSGTATGTARGIDLAGAKLAVGAYAISAYSQGFPGQIYQAMHWARALSDDEIREISRNPWQLFAPQSSRLWVPGAVSGGGAVNLATSLSVAVQAAQAATASVAAAIQQSRTTSADVAAAIQIARTVQASVDGAIQAATTATATVNAYVQAGSNVSASINAAVQAAISASVSMGSAVQVTRTGNTTLDAAIQTARTATASLGAAVQAAASASASVNAYVQAGTTASVNVAAAVQAAQIASASVDSAIAIARSASASLAAAIAVTQSVGAAVHAAVQASQAATASVGAYVYSASVPDTFTGPARDRIGSRALRADPFGTNTLRAPGVRIGSTTP